MLDAFALKKSFREEVERAFFEAGKALIELRDGLRSAVGHRLSRVYSSALEECVQKFLEMLGKLNRGYRF
ncbi:MAG: hypothetical protein KME50_22025 [Nostoc desertorum CM1-VF14]|jgi:hypothetical protein|nr:hypothetical protein [Nostoc desertorum CM1-VF14]